MTLDNALLSIIIPAIVSILLGIIGYRSNKNQAKNAQNKDLNDFTSQLLEQAREMNKQELETIRTINLDLKKEILELRGENQDLKKENELIRKRLNICERALTKICPECEIEKEIDNGL